MKQLLSFVMAALALTSCADKAPKALILFYSQTGATETLVTELQKQVAADVERFNVTEVYDGDYMATIERVKQERDNGTIPTLVPLQSDLASYDVIYLAYPIWFGTCAPPVQALLKTVSLEGKTIVPLCTFGSGGLESSIAYLRRALPKCKLAEGFGIRNARIQCAADELNRFLIENGYKEGEIEALPEYSAQAPVTAEELAIYQEATAGYPYPMGEPVSAGSRAILGGTDYIFTVNSTTPDGNATQGQVFVSTREGRPSEFTKVVR